MFPFLWSGNQVELLNAPGAVTCKNRSYRKRRLLKRHWETEKAEQGMESKYPEGTGGRRP